MASSRPQRTPLKPKNTRSGPYTVEADGATKVGGETIPRRHPNAKKELIYQPEPNITTVFDILRNSASKFGKAPSLGSRKVVKTHVENKKVSDGKGGMVEKPWTAYELSDYSYETFEDLERNALRVGSGLRKLGLEAHDRVEIYAATSAFWFTVAHGIGSQSMTIVTAYDTLGPEGLSHSLKQTGAKAIFLDPALIPAVNRALDEGLAISAMIYNDSAPQPVNTQHIEDLHQAHPNVSVQSYTEFLSSSEAEPFEPVPPTASDLACIMYTSGSTGAPKGVMLKHSNIVAAIAGVQPIVGEHLYRARMLTYLPLAHIIEFVFENGTLYWGGVMGYGSPRTLTDAAVRNCAGDIRAFKPEIMVGVPAVWESVKKGILGKVGPAGSMKNKVFWGALGLKENLMGRGWPGSGLLDSLVFNKIKEATGGNLRLVLNGGGQIAEATARFVSFSICPMIGGYGLTETAGMGAINDPLAWTTSNTGMMEASVEVKLVDVPDLGYSTSSNPPKGEVWIRGGAVIEGYFNNPEETASAFQDGWFKTGDIGLFDSTGQLKIIDRKKNLVKTLNGEYIALEKLESLYRASAVVAQICIYASPTQARPLAIIDPAPPALQKIGADCGLQNSTHAELCRDDKVRAAVLKDMVAVGRRNGLQGIEIVQDVVMSEQDWTPQTGFLTNAQKLNRAVVKERFGKEIERFG